jgi:hypothetical protein
MLSAELAVQRREARRLFEDAITYHDAKVEEAARSEAAYRKAKAKAWVQAPSGPAKYKEAWVDAETADLRCVRDIHAGHVKSALELIRERKQELSFLQSEAAASREEANVGRFGPEVAA